jgi:hypothetical protein
MPVDTDSMDESRTDQEFNQKREIFEWKDITDDFFENVQELELGELLHYELFGLFEAMSAIEMMDKKMDIGMVEGKEKIPLTLESAVMVK